MCVVLWISGCGKRGVIGSSVVCVSARVVGKGCSVIFIIYHEYWDHSAIDVKNWRLVWKGRGRKEVLSNQTDSE